MKCYFAGIHVAVQPCMKVHPQEMELAAGIGCRGCRLRLCAHWPGHRPKSRTEPRGANHAWSLATNVSRLLINRQMAKLHAIMRGHAAQITRYVFNIHLSFAIDLAETSGGLIDVLTKLK